MSFDFGRLVEEQRRERAAEVETPAVVITFKTERGSFTVAPELFEDGREGDLARRWAQALQGRKVTIARKVVERDGTVVVHWRHVRVITAPA